MKARHKPMRLDTVYVLEIGGTPVLAFAAHSRQEALSVRKEQWLRDDLMSAQTGGRPLWDGQAPMTVRQASAAEAETYSETARVTVDGSGETLLVFLVELDSV